MVSISRKCFPKENFQSTTSFFCILFSFQPLSEALSLSEP